MKKGKNNTIRLWLTALLISLIGAILSFFVSCSPRVVYREVNSVIRDTINKQILRVDTFFSEKVMLLRDSVYIRDSVYLNKDGVMVKERVVEKLRVVKDDHIKNAKRYAWLNNKIVKDRMDVKGEVVEKPPNLWHRLLNEFSPYIIVGICLFLLIAWAKSRSKLL